MRCSHARALFAPHAPISSLLYNVEKYAKLCGGEGGIRTLGTGYPVRQISNLVPSTTRPPLRSGKSSTSGAFGHAVRPTVPSDFPRRKDGDRMALPGLSVARSGEYDS